MLSAVLGALIVLSASGYWGYDRCKKEKEALCLFHGLISLCDYTEMHIRLFRTPIYDIYEKFSDEYLEGIGFMVSLRSGDVQKAMSAVDCCLNEKGSKVFEEFLSRIGSGYEEDQRALCRFTSDYLKAVEADARENLPQRLKMYKLLPVLIACSVIILMI